MSSIGAFGPSGFHPIRQSTERTLLAGVAGYERHLIYAHGAQILSTTVDARNTPTDRLGVGLILAHNGSGGYANYDPDSATEWQREAAGILDVDLRIPDFDGTDQDRQLAVLVGGPVDESALGGIDEQAKAQLGSTFLRADC